MPSVPFSRPTIEDDDVAAVAETLRSGWITSGPRVQAFEAAFRERLGVRHALAVSSATAGLHLLLASLDLGPEDEVVVPSLTWATTANVVELCGARTVFADVDPETLCLDPADVARRITPRTRALIPVHFAGQPADLAALRTLAAEHGLDLIEDAAHALGTAYGDEEIGSAGNPAVFSFHPIKNITTAEGGMIVLDDDERATRLRLLRFHGVSKDAWQRYHQRRVHGYDVLLPGFKYNLTDLQAALGLVQFGKLERFNARRTALAERYLQLLEGLAELAPLGRVPYSARHCWHLFVVRLRLEALDCDRDAFMSELAAEGVATGLHFQPLHQTAYYRERYGYGPGDLPHTEDVGARIFSLPLFPGLSEAEQDHVVAALKTVLARHRKRGHDA
ncbi:MAG: aminotransferase class I/II-fold pyridoxal phosphate-dependent enzyme [Planctomycetota bacterium]|nr:MAG: aminotransferase class I/II-fold pyridoxal phosphate-dependent enzyme [Planctomycetota bacterium]